MHAPLILYALAHFPNGGVLFKSRICAKDQIIQHFAHPLLGANPCTDHPAI